MKEKTIFIDTEEWNLFSGHYLFDGKEYVVEFYATSFYDANKRIDAIKNGLVLDGQIMGQEIDFELGGEEYNN